MGAALASIFLSLCATAQNLPGYMSVKEGWFTDGAKVVLDGKTYRPSAPQTCTKNAGKPATTSTTPGACVCEASSWPTLGWLKRLSARSGSKTLELWARRMPRWAACS